MRLQLLMVKQLDRIIKRLSDSSGAPGAKTVHDVRKDIKRLRAELLLVERHLGRKHVRREDRELAGVARELSPARDAEVMLATLDSLVERHPRVLSHRGGVRRARRRLLAARAGAHSRLDDPLRRAELLGRLLSLRERMGAWDLDSCDPSLITDGYVRLYRDGRRRWRSADQGGSNALAMHKWRRQVKSLRYASEALAECGDPAGAKRLEKLARRADTLGEVLGDEHDLVVFMEWVETTPRKRGKHRVDGRTRRILRRKAKLRRQELRSQALRRGEALYGRRPGRLAAAARLAVS